MPVARMWRSHDLKKSYDVGIIADRGVTTLCERAETNKLLGVNSRLVGPREVAKLVPGMSVADQHQPVLAGLYHPPGGIIRHDAVVWGYARGVDRLGVEIHPHTE